MTRRRAAWGATARLARFGVLGAAIPLIVACGPASEPALVSTQAMAVSGVRFDSVVEGVVNGFDLDGLESPDGDRRGCGHADFVSTAGQRGIDNQFATIFALVDAVAPGVVTSLVQQNIDDGLMILVFGLYEYDDGHREVVLRSTSGEPLLGTDGRLLDRQTFDVGAATELGRTTDVRVGPDGEVVAGPFDFRIEITIFARPYKLTMQDGFVRYGLTAGEGVQGGLVGGAIEVDELMVAIDQASAAAEADYRSLFAGLIEDTADMRIERGKCRALSTAFSLELVSAFMF